MRRHQERLHELEEAQEHHRRLLESEGRRQQEEFHRLREEEEH